MRSHFQMIFQDPYTSLNPRRKIEATLMEGLIIHGFSTEYARQQAIEILDLVGLQQDVLYRYPHEFSGGQRQRIAIARALLLKPKLIIADEAVSALDVSIQKQIIELLKDIKRQSGLSLIFITHDLRVAAEICDHIAVMRLGQIVEYGSTQTILSSPQHEYTQSLLHAIPGKKYDSAIKQNL